jgi:primosomal protein N' (replication factor Y)
MPPVSIPQFTENAQVSVLINQALPRTLTYKVGAGQTVAEGALVQVPLGNKQGYGVVVGPSETSFDPAKIKSIEKVLDLPPIKKALRDFVLWVADYTLSPAGSVLAMALGGQSVLAARKPRKEKEVASKVEPEKHALNDAQQKAAGELVAEVKEHRFAVTLLDGVTGSGKTEVYSEAIEAALNAGKQALVMLPEIALTTQLVGRLTRRFGFAPVVWHSNLTPATRRDNWKAVADGSAKLIIGARSALFLPYAELGIIVVDEEHDGSYKQEEGVVYHARDMAVVRGKMEEIPVVLASATPSLETVLNVRNRRYLHAHLPERHGAAIMPKIHLVDVKAEKMPRGGWISPSLQNAMRETLQRQEQSLLFLNRRGYAPLTLCRHCGHRFACPQCTAWLVEHRAEGKRRLVCHHCGFAQLYPQECPECHDKENLSACGPGVERLAEEAKKLFPNARIATLASDTQEHLAQIHQTIAAMESGQIDILIGTQIVAKGYHFPRLTLVGVVDGDLGLQGGDLRAAEHTFQLLAQVAGRSGRVDVHGHVYIQTVQPKHPVMQNLQNYDRDTLVETLIKEREKYAMPPFARMAVVTLSGTNLPKTKAAANLLAQHIPENEGVEVLGPAPAPIALLRGRHRLRFLVRTSRKEKIQDYLRGWLASVKIPHTLRIGVDIDPQHFS